MAWQGWSDAEAYARSRALTRLLRWDASKKRGIMDEEGWVSIHDICNTLEQSQRSSGNGKGKGKKRNKLYYEWTQWCVLEVVATSVHHRKGPRFEVAHNNAFGRVTHVRATRTRNDWQDGWQDGWQDDWQDWQQDWQEDWQEDDWLDVRLSPRDPADPNASSSARPHPQPPSGTSDLNGQPPPWRPDPMISGIAAVPTIPAKAPPPILPAPASTILAKAPPPIRQLPAPASAMPKAASPSVPAPAAAEPAAAEPAAVEPAAAKPAAEGPTCIICHQGPPTHAFIHADSAHLLVCWECADLYIAHNAVKRGDGDDADSRNFRFCPMCREGFLKVLPVYPVQNRNQ
jgi:hypothetical protein